MKRILFALFASVTLALFAGCGSDDDDAVITIVDGSETNSPSTDNDGSDGSGGSDNGGSGGNYYPPSPPPPPVLHTTVTVQNDASVSATVTIGGVDSPNTISIGSGASRPWARTGTGGSTITFNPGYPGAEDQTMSIPGGVNITVHVTDSAGSPGTIEVSI